jgi:hypothetical protein
MNTTPIHKSPSAPQPAAGGTQASGISLFEPVITTITAKGEALLTIPGVFGVRPGLRRAQVGLTDAPAIIVVTTPGQAVGSLPTELDGLPVEQRVATARELTEGLLPLSVWEGRAPEAAPLINYAPPDPAEVALVEMSVHHITCHVGPDSGWSTLKPFLEGTRTSLTVAMYDFYAEHIIDTVARLGEETQANLNMILDVRQNEEMVKAALGQSWGDRLDFVQASVAGPNRIFSSAYHTKVAVRDSSAFWLSSGNWTPTSQPVIGPGAELTLYNKGNREWHVIIEDEPLAQMYEKFIKYDMRQAREAGAPEAAPEMPDVLVPMAAFLEAEAAVVQDHPFVARTFATGDEPVRVKPLMSPDNYAKEILALIQSAESTLYLQFSYISQPSMEKFDEIISAIANKMRDGLDVRILVSNNQEAEDSELLIGVRWWQRSMFREQTKKMHNKGILIDGKIAVVGSNNWSSAGTQYNRDSSLVFYSEEIAQYYSEVFLFDWDNLSKPVSSEPEVAVLLAPESGPTRPGMVRVPWGAWFEE